MFLAGCPVPPAWGHAFGARYDLPLPLWLYLSGAGTVVALSFFVSALLLHGAAGRLWEIRRSSAPRCTLPAPALACARAASVAMFALILAAGFFGSQDTFKNLAPTMVWVIWWVGLAYVSALLGNVWALINPWATLFAWAEKAYARCTHGRALARERPYPVHLGVWPGVVLFVLFAWLELVWEGAEVPARLATVIVIYSLMTWGGMLVYGREVWLDRGEAFSLAFGLFARFAPLEFHRRAGGRLECRLRLFAVGLLTERPVPASMMIFAVLMLSTVTLDGFLETAAWVGILDWVGTEPALRSMLLALRSEGLDLLALMKTVALLVFPTLFTLVYLLVARLATWMAGSGASALSIAQRMVLSLVPIAIAYHLAHYLSFLLLAGQLMIPLASDPFGFGWNLLGTAGYRMDVSIVNARFAWYTAVVAIVLGHVIAVVLAHAGALRVFGNVRAALRSQIPVMALMVGYTMSSLWILSQPIVQYSAGG